jgi:hypothetical protein
MAASARNTLLRAALAAAIVATVGGCATRYDEYGNTIYRWQFGQDTSRAIDYSNPRLPQLPANRPRMDLWPVPSPYQFRDLSQYSQLTTPAPLPSADMSVGDNAACAASVSFCKPAAPLALLASRVDARGSSRIIVGR